MTLRKAILTFLLLFSLGGFSQNYVSIPNIFTPNGDGENDVYTIRGIGLESLTCTIFNRYGETIYRYHGVNGSWDGYTHAGVKVSAGTYFVQIDAVAIDGTVIKQQGSVQVQY